MSRDCHSKNQAENSNAGGDGGGSEKDPRQMGYIAPSRHVHKPSDQADQAKPHYIAPGRGVLAVSHCH